MEDLSMNDKVARFLDKLFVGFVVIIIVTILTVALMGCVEPVSPGMMNAARTEAIVLLGEAQREITELEAKRDREGLSPEEAGALASAKATVGEIRERVESIPAGNDANLFDWGTAIAPSLPPPFNIGAGIGLGALAEWWRGRKKRSSFDALVKAIERAKSKNPTLEQGFNEASSDIRAELSQPQRNLIDKIRNGKGRLTL